VSVWGGWGGVHGSRGEMKGLLGEGKARGGGGERSQPKTASSARFDSSVS